MNLEYPPEVASSIRKTIATVLDFIIDTMTTSPENMNGTRESKEQIQRDAVDAGNIAGETTDLENMQYACILWNDEDHSFTEVIDRVSGATNMPSNYARKIAETVDTQVSTQFMRFFIYPSHSCPLLKINSHKDNFYLGSRDCGSF